jgi:hypothetical protein
MVLYQKAQKSRRSSAGYYADASNIAGECWYIDRGWAMRELRKRRWLKRFVALINSQQRQLEWLAREQGSLGQA